MKEKKICILVATIVLLTITQVSLFGQKNSVEKLLPNSCSNAREQFKKDLNAFIDYQVNQNWSLMYSHSISSLSGDSSEKAFIDEMELTFDKDSFLQSFFPKASTLVNKINGNDVWLVEGCGYYKRKGKTVSIFAGLEAVNEKNKWYFSYLTVIPDGIGGGETKCSK